LLNVQATYHLLASIVVIAMLIDRLTRGKE
jgi:hypothetical protein